MQERWVVGQHMIQTEEGTAGLLAWRIAAAAAAALAGRDPGPLSCEEEVGSGAGGSSHRAAAAAMEL